MSAIRKVAGGRAGSSQRRIYPATDIDEDVIKALKASDVPLSAYDLVERLQRNGRRLFGVSIYRSLSRLCAREAIERIEMTARYRIRDTPGALLMTCDQCGRTYPVAASRQFEELGSTIAEHGFVPSKVALEATGICRTCRLTADEDGEVDE